MDDVDFLPDRSFRVNIYNNRLEYTTKMVSVYKTEEKHIKAYKIQGVAGIIIISRDQYQQHSTWIGKHKGTMEYPLYMNPHGIVPIAATNMLGTLVTYVDDAEPTLF